MDPAEGVVTERMLAYRECVRTVWNGFFRTLPEGWHEFINVEHALFSGMVLVQLFENDWPTRGRDSILVRPDFGPSGARVMWAREAEDNVWQFQERQLLEPSIVLTFLDFFDWRSEGIWDLEYVRARVQECPEDPALEGADLLVPALSATFHLDVENRQSC